MQHDDEKERLAFTDVRLIDIGKGGAACRRGDGGLLSEESARAFPLPLHCLEAVTPQVM